MQALPIKLNFSPVRDLCLPILTARQLGMINV